MSTPSGEFGQSRPADRQPVLRPDIAGIRKRVLPVAETISGAADSIVSAMVKTPFPKRTAEDIVGGERGRILGLGSAYWPFFYGLPIDLLAQAGHPVEKLFEKGPSLEAHLAALDPSLQPRRSLAVDFPHIAQGAKVAVEALKRGQLLRPDAKYRVTTEHNWRVKIHRHADLSVSLLEAQYDKPLELARQLFQHSDTVLVGDVLHGRTALPSPVAAGDTVKLTTSKEPGRTTGFQLKLLEEVGEHEDPSQPYTRRYYKYHILTDPQVIGGRFATQQIDVGASQEGVCTVFVDRVTGKESMQAWTFRPKEGAPAESLGKVFAAEETLHDLYEHTPDWDGNGALGVLDKLGAAIAGRRNPLIETVVATMVPNAQEMSGRLPLTILARNKEQLMQRAQAGQLRHIGKGKTYATVDDFLAMVQTDLMRPSQSGRAYIDEITTFDPPPLLDIIASRKPGVIRDMLKTVGQTQ